MRLDIQEDARWVGAPLKRLPLGASINEAVIDDSQPWRVKLMRTLSASYGRAANYRRVLPLIERLVFSPEINLAAVNMATIRTVATYLGLGTRFVTQSELPYAGKGTEPHAALVKAIGCDGYVVGGGAEGYQ